jgi:hypothetical protein
MGKTSFLLFTILLLLKVSASSCDYLSMANELSYPGMKITSLEAINPIYFSFAQKKDPLCACSFLNYISNKMDTRPYDQLLPSDLTMIQSCLLVPSRHTSCYAPRDYFPLPRLSILSEEKLAIDAYNRSIVAPISKVPLELKKGDTICHRDPENLLGVVIHHTGKIYLSKHNLKDPDYKKNLQEALDSDEYQSFIKAKTGATLLEDFTTNNPSAYVKILNQEFQNGMRKWSGIPYHYLVSYDSKKEKWTTHTGRPISVVGAHAGAEKPLRSYPRSRFPDPSWQRKSLSALLKEKDIPSHPLQCIRNGVKSLKPLKDNWNDFSIGIVVKGHFAKIEGKLDPLNPTVYRPAYKGGLKEHLSELIKELKRKYPNISKVIRHGDLTATFCPGTIGGEVTRYGHSLDSDRGITGELDQLVGGKK